MDAGDFGPVTISKSVTIDGANMGSIGFGGQTNGIYVDGSSSINVVIHNLTLDGQGSGEEGVSIINAANVTIDNCKIEGFTDTGINLFPSGAENVVITNTVIDGANVASGGVMTDETAAAIATVALDHVTIKGMTDAAVTSFNGNMQITNSVLTQNQVGVEAQTGAVISVANSAITSNSQGVCSCSGSKIRLDTNDIYDNPTAIADCGGQIKTSGTNRTSGAITATSAEVSHSVLF
jgi:parallel beta-helix repeat protein